MRHIVELKVAEIIKLDDVKMVLIREQCRTEILWWIVGSKLRLIKIPRLVRQFVLKSRNNVCYISIRFDNDKWESMCQNIP